MITVKEAREIIFENGTVATPISTALKHAAGKVLAQDIYAAIDIPFFTQSSMDGYAFNFEDYKANQVLQVTGEVAAGEQKSIVVKPGEAVRIFTGAAVPAGADTVVMQEKAIVEDQRLRLADSSILKAANTRPRGSEIKRGELALSKGDILSPAAIGFLAGIGISTVDCYPSPLVSIIVTGNELQSPGVPLEHGQVYESNSYALSAYLSGIGIEQLNVQHAPDNLEVLTGLLNDALQVSDIVLLTGGVSVGDYDFVIKATENCGVKQLFHKIKQKPGKPLYFGMKEKKMLFGLPGNPSSVFTCFVQYVVPAIKQFQHNNTKLIKMQAPLMKPFKKAPGLTHFLKGFYNGSHVDILAGQESYKMRSYALANCMVEIGDETEEVGSNELVDVYIL